MELGHKVNIFISNSVISDFCDEPSEEKNVLCIIQLM